MLDSGRDAPVVPAGTSWSVQPRDGATDLSSSSPRPIIMTPAFRHPPSTRAIVSARRCGPSSCGRCSCGRCDGPTADRASKGPEVCSVWAMQTDRAPGTTASMSCRRRLRVPIAMASTRFADRARDEYFAPSSVPLGPEGHSVRILGLDLGTPVVDVETPRRQR